MTYGSDPITGKLNDLVGSNELYMNLLCFDELSTAEQALIGTWELATEVCNGGLLQYFHNSSRDRAEPMIDILRVIDAQHAATILESAMTLAGSGTRWGDEPSFLAAVNSMPDDVKTQLHKFDGDLYDELDHVYRQVFTYMSKHREQIEVETPADFWTEPVSQ